MGISFLNHYRYAISNNKYKTTTRYHPITKLQRVKKLPPLFWFVVQSIKRGNGAETETSAVRSSFVSPCFSECLRLLKQESLEDAKIFMCIEQESETGLVCDEIVSVYSSPADKGLVIQLKQGRFFHEDYCLAYQALQDLPAFLLYPQTSDLTSR